MDSRRLSLILAGGVSLGAWEAGALVELLYALDWLARERNDRWQIDVITGSSAGAMTAALAGRAILHDRGAFAAALHDAWVRAPDARRFLRHPGTESLVTNAVQDKLLRKYFGPDSRVPFRAAPAALSSPTDTLRLGFALSNMVGIDYGIPYTQVPGRQSRPGSALARDDANFVSTFFSDHASFTFSAASRDDPALWWRVARASVASGSFPLIFPPGLLARTRADYPHALADNGLPMAMQFVDGGAFHNEPLRLAIALAADADGMSASSDRTFILLDPRLNRSKRDPSFVRPHKLVANALRVVRMIAGEASARDWLRAGRVTQRLSQRDQLAAELVSLVNAVPEDGLETRTSSSLGRVHSAAASVIAGNDQAPRKAFVDNALSAIVARHTAVTAAIGEQDKPRVRSLRLKLFAHLMFLSDAAAGGLTRSPLRLFAITSTPDLTAGDPLRGFLGFLDERWREHDFRLGRRCTRDRLPRILGVDPWPREAPPDAKPSHNPLYDPEPEWGDFSHVSVSDADVEIRTALREFLVQRVDRVLGEPPFRVSTIGRFIVRHFLNKRLRKAFDAGHPSK